jgi:signal transduction histidine kinase
MITWKGFLLGCILFCGVLSLSFWRTSAISQQAAEPPSAQIQSLGNTQNIQTAFTEEEQRWLAKNHTVRVRLGKAPPYSFFKEEPLGISGDYLNAVAQRAGFQVKYFPDIPWSDALKYIKNREKIDLLPALTETPDRKEYIAFTQNYLTSPRVIYTREDSGFVDSLEDLSNKTISVERGYFMHQKLSDEYPNIKLLIEETTEDALESLSLGKADAYVGNLTAGTYTIKMKGLNNIKVAAPAPFGDLILAMGARNDWPELASIINKVLATFNHKDHVAIRDKWMSPIRYEYGISTADILKWGLGISSIALAIIITILIWNKKLANEITARKKVDQEKIKLIHNLKERTRDLKDAQEKIVRSEKLVALGKLAGLLGHEIKAPLGVIKHSFEFLKIRLDQDVDVKIGEHLNLVHAKINTIDETIDDVLDFARTKKLELIAVDPNNLVEDLIGEIPVPTHIRIVWDLGSHLPCIAVDKRPIQQVFQNIISNAVDAMDEGGTLTVSTHKQISDNAGHDFVTISFRDTGEGISPDHVGKVFEPLFSTKVKGTGLGLVACENIIHAHKGSIEVSSEMGKGSTFTVKLPVKE